MVSSGELTRLRQTEMSFPVLHIAQRLRYQLINQAVAEKILKAAIPPYLGSGITVRLLNDDSRHLDAYHDPRMVDGTLVGVDIYDFFDTS